MSTEQSYHFIYWLQVSKKSLWSLILYIFFHDLIHVYSPGAGGIQPPGDKVLMSTETSCHFGHLLLVSNHRDNSFWKIHCFTFFPYKSIRDQIWPCCKLSQGQPMVIIWTNLVVLKHPILMTTERPFLFAHMLQVSKWSLRNLTLYKFLMILYISIAPGQGQKTPWGHTFDVNRKPLSLQPFVASFSNKPLWILILYTFFNVFPHVYSPGAGADNPLWTKSWFQQKSLVTLPICCKFQKNIF